MLPMRVHKWTGQSSNEQMNLSTASSASQTQACHPYHESPNRARRATYSQQKNYKQSQYHES